MMTEITSSSLNLIRAAGRRLGLLGRGGLEADSPEPEEGEQAPAGLLEHFPSRRPEPGQSRWEWPEGLSGCAGAGSAWVEVLKRLYQRRLSFPYAISPEGGLLLHSLAMNAQPRVVVETGACIGVSTIWMASALRAGAMVHSFDHFRPVRDSAGDFSLGDVDRELFVRQQIGAAGLEERVTLHRGDSSAGLKELARNLNGEKVQLAFIDGDHTIGGVRRDFEALEPMLATGGLVVLHDTFPRMSRWKGPRKMMDDLSRRESSMNAKERGNIKGRYQVLDLYLSPVNYGLGVLRRIG